MFHIWINMGPCSTFTPSCGWVQTLSFALSDILLVLCKGVEKVHKSTGADKIRSHGQAQHLPIVPLHLPYEQKQLLGSDLQLKWEILTEFIVTWTAIPAVPQHSVPAPLRDRKGETSTCADADDECILKKVKGPSLPWEHQCILSTQGQGYLSSCCCLSKMYCPWQPGWQRGLSEVSSHWEVNTSLPLIWQV